MADLSSESHVLMGWKDIAKYLNMGVRTVQRYECEQELPVRRPAGGPTGAVIATRGELDQWLGQRPKRRGSSERKPSPGMPDARLESLDVGIMRMRQLRTVMTQRRADLMAAIAVLHRTLQAASVNRTHEKVQRP